MLNYKKLPYKTTWMEYPELAPTLKGLGVAPNEEGPPYTSPTVRFPDGTFAMDTKKIAAELEKRHPSPSMHLDSSIIAEVEAAWLKFFTAIRGVFMPKIPQNLLNPTSATYFEETRAKRFGMPLSELGRTSGGESAWQAAEPALKELGDILKRNGGPFTLGETVGFADMILIGGLASTRKVGGGVYDRTVLIEPTLQKLYEASKDLVDRDSY